MNKAVLFLFVTTLGLGALSLHLVRTLRAEREQVQSLQTRIGELQQTAQAAEEPPDLEPEAFFISPAAGPQPAPAPAAVPAPAMATDVSDARAPSHDQRIRRQREVWERQRALLRDPEYREAMRAQSKLEYARSLPDLAQELGVSDEQADQLLGLLVDQRLRAMEEMRNRIWTDGQPDPSELQEMQRKARLRQQANEAELSSLLGPEKMQAWKDYQATMGVRHEVNQLRGLLASKGVPLQDELVKPLMRALADEQQRMTQEWTQQATMDAGLMWKDTTNASSRMKLRERQLERTAQHHQRLRDAASNILSAEQLELFEMEQNAQLKMQEAQIRVMRVQAEERSRGETDGLPAANVAIMQSYADSPPLER